MCVCVCVYVCVCVCVSAFTLYSLILEEKQTENYYLICGSLKNVRQFFIKLSLFYSLGYDFNSLFLFNLNTTVSVCFFFFFFFLFFSYIDSFSNVIYFKHLK